MRGVVGLGAAVLLVLGASRAGAAVIFNDNFDGENVPPASWVMNDNSFVNFDVTSGSVDLLTMGNPFGLAGSGTNASGNFVDLDGSTEQGGTLATKQTFSYDAGQTVTLSLDIGGSERTGTDGLFGGFQFSGAPSITGVTTTGFTDNSLTGNQLLGTAQLASTAPFQSFTITFTALSGGSLTAMVGTTSHDDMGPLLDDVSISESLVEGVPEPASWAMMILGLGGAGVMLRRGRATVAV
jgi:PEP-CTERM motif